MGPDERTDDELLEQAIAGAARGDTASKLAYGELVRRHQSWLVSLVSRLMAVHTSEAEDLAQDAFVRTYVGLSTMASGVNFRAWVRVIALRLAFNERRNRGTRRRIRDSFPPPPANPGAEPALAARDQLLGLLGTLSYPYREILVLRHLEELPLAEIAEHLDIGVSAAKMRLLRAREAFVEEHERRAAQEHGK